MNCRKGTLAIIVCCMSALLLGYSPAPVIAAASPNAFGKPSATVSNPGDSIMAVRGTRPFGWVDQTRSEVLARNGVVATSEPQAAMAGVEILQNGGNAIDAAVATMATIGLQESHSTGIGAEMFVIIWDAKTKKLYQISANGPSPKNYSRELFAANGFKVDGPPYGNPKTSGILSAMIPGSVDGWDKMLKRFGTMTFKEVLEPARKNAVEGFPVHEVIAGMFKRNKKNLCEGDPDTAAIFCKGGDVPAMYSILKNPDMGRLFQVLQEKGVDAFYKGEVAEAMVKKANSMGVVLPAGMKEFWSMDDLKSYEAKWVEPLKTTYHGYEIYETPPPSQGWAALEMLNILEVCAEKKGINLAALGRENPLLTHFQVEAKKLAYSDLHRYNADPRFAKDLYDKLNKYFLNKSYAKSLCDLIDMGETTGTPKARNSDRLGNLPGGTIYGASADRWGNMVSFVYSVYTAWGSIVTVPGYGFQYSSRGAMFTFDPNHPNTLEGGKEPFITIIAAFIMKDGEPVMAFGNMGGSTQPLGHVQHVVNMIDLGYNVQATSDAARWDHSQNADGTATGTLLLDYYLYDRIASTMQLWGHTSITRNRGMGGGYEGILFEKDPNEPVPFFGDAGKGGNSKGPVNGVYRAGADTLRKDAIAVGW